MNPLPEILLALAGSPAPGAAPIGLTDALLLLFTAGLLVVIYQLNLVVRRLDAFERRLNAVRARSDSVAPAPALEPPAGDTLQPELVAAIVAACHVALGRPVRIVSIKDEAGLQPAGSLEGSRQTFASHQIR